MKLPKRIQNYLSKMSVGKWNVEPSPSRFYDHIIVIPAINEYLNIKKLLESLSQNDEEYLHNTLIIPVINNSPEDRPIIIEENRKTIEYLKEQINDASFPLNIGLIDASSSGRELPLKIAGVGSARKIGMESAVHFFDYRSVFR
jgi:hypothetical protein